MPSPALNFQRTSSFSGSFSVETPVCRAFPRKTGQSAKALAAKAQRTQRLHNRSMSEVRDRLMLNPLEGRTIECEQVLLGHRPRIEAAGPLLRCFFREHRQDTFADPDR